MGEQFVRIYIIYIHIHIYMVFLKHLVNFSWHNNNIKLKHHNNIDISMYAALICTLHREKSIHD